MTKKTRAKARRALLTLSLVLVVAFAAVGGTIAWLTATTNEVTNTFTQSEVSIELKEHVYDPEREPTDADKADGVIGGLDTSVDPVESQSNYQLIPGAKLPKDPFIYVDNPDSEDVWVGVAITVSPKFGQYLSYKEATDWKTLDTVTNNDGSVTTYYMYTAGTLGYGDDPVYILADDQISVLGTVTNTQMEAVTAEEPKMTFVGYAVQADYLVDGKKVSTADDAEPLLKDLMGISTGA